MGSGFCQSVEIRCHGTVYYGAEPPWCEIPEMTARKRTIGWSVRGRGSKIRCHDSVHREKMHHGQVAVVRWCKILRLVGAKSCVWWTQNLAFGGRKILRLVGAKSCVWWAQNLAPTTTIGAERRECLSRFFPVLSSGRSVGLACHRPKPGTS